MIGLLPESLKWNICQYPTLADAQEASMSLEEYEEFVFQACHLDKDDPVKYWLEFGERTQGNSRLSERGGRTPFRIRGYSFTLPGKGPYLDTGNG